MSEKKTVEQNMAALEEIVAKLEKGDTELDVSLALFQQGVELTKQLNADLDAAEQQIHVLLKDADGELHEENFVAGEEA